ncbi:hypothetical protein Lyticum_00333 [Lyticum sinuosum]|uniref:Uncharacterized protein n=1 Tax=Lyticum sinuosum TaxID=1332059 RepID=A0AAE4VJS6_9RICK|nr:hypothetical protein [Lyticum sinuosum]
MNIFIVKINIVKIEQNFSKESNINKKQIQFSKKL